MARSLTKSVAWYTTGNVFIRAASFLLLPLYSNFISPPEFGIYSIIMSFYAVLSVLFQGGLQSALSKYYLEREEKNEIFSVIMNIIIVWGVLLLAVVLLFSSNVSLLLLGTPDYGNLFRLITTSLYLETIVFFILHLFKTREEALRAVIYISAGALMNIALNIHFVYFRGEGIEGIIKAQLFSSLLTLVILIPYFSTNYKFDLAKLFNTSFFRPLFLFTLPVFLSGLFAALVDVADRFIIFAILGEEQTGLYSFAYRLALIMNIFVISFRTAFTPYSINLYASGDYQEKFGRVLLNLISAGGLIIIIVSFFANELFELEIFGGTIFSGRYQGGIIVLPFILTGYFFSAIMSFYSVYPYISSKSYHFLFADLLAFAVNITLNIILIPTAGIKGAALATLFAFLAGAVYLYTISWGRIKISYNRKRISVIVLSTIVILTAGIYLDTLLTDIILLMVYTGIILSMGGINLNILRLKSGI
jgi:O-antigen/teichoic acid export membrane protein